MSESQAAPQAESAIVTLTGLLGAPVVWAFHFAFVYGLQSILCAPGGRWLEVPLEVVAPAIGVATFVAAAAIAGLWLLVRGRAPRSEAPAPATLARRAAGPLALLSLFGVLAAGAAAALLPPCAA
jgi:hypothetical protein